MAKGSKTKAAAGAAGGAFGAAFFDPTGVALGTFVFASGAAAVGATYHIVRKSAKLIRQEMNQNRESKASDSSIPQSIPDHIIMQEQVEATMRKLASATMGVGISGLLFTVMPHAGVGFSINVTEAGYQAMKLQDIARTVGGKRVLLSNICKRNVTTQVLAGIFIKGTTTALFLGSELDVFLEHMSEALPIVSGCGGDVAQAALEFHKEMLEHHPFHETVGMMNEVSDKIKYDLVDPVLYHSLGLEHGEIEWGDHVPTKTVLELGGASAVVNKIAEVAIEVPLDKGAKEVTGSA